MKVIAGIGHPCLIPLSKMNVSDVICCFYACFGRWISISQMIDHASVDDLISAFKSS